MSRTSRGRVSVGIDVRGTKTAVLAVAVPGVEGLFRVGFPAQATLRAGHLLGQLPPVLARLRSELGLGARLAVGVSVPEVVDLDGLVATDVVIPGLTGDLREWVEIGVERVESDVRAAAHAEARAGAGRGFPSFGYVSIGTGI